LDLLQTFQELFFRSAKLHENKSAKMLGVQTYSATAKSCGLKSVGTLSVAEHYR